MGCSPMSMLKSMAFAKGEENGGRMCSPPPQKLVGDSTVRSVVYRDESRRHSCAAADDILPSFHASAAAERDVAAPATEWRHQAYPYAVSPVPSAAWVEHRYCSPTAAAPPERIDGAATDVGGLTTIFSDENPNACRIV
ncbi:unnamed protein product [Spirodela intermedia]|uniref:Uncharacterized protein n=1 Tax=Spirodela intermedia TaxID=51605 RepID=A0A7I8J5G9_SPIIN|nr:unnamed protein product [Spirodela intermedia]CAA6665468.1 unnamed protein product [Spirodela intermedia]